MMLSKELRESVDAADVKKIDELVQGPPGLDLEELDELLANAVGSSTPDVIDALFRHGAHITYLADVNAFQRAEISVYEVMLKNGWDINNTTLRVTPVMLAIKNEKLLRWLLDQGANPNTCSVYRPGCCGHIESPLEYAAEVSNPTGLEILLSYGAQMVPNALYHTMTMRNRDPAQHVSHVPHMKLLLDHGADINHLSKKHGTPPHCAVDHGRKDMLQYLVDCREDRSIRDRFGQTPADGALEQGSMDLYAILEFCRRSPRKRPEICYKE